VYSLRFDADRGPWSTCRRTSFRASTDGPRRWSGSAGWQRAAGPARGRGGAGGASCAA